MIAEMPHSSAGNVKGIKSAVHLSETVLDTYDAPHGTADLECPRIGRDWGISRHAPDMA